MIKIALGIAAAVAIGGVALMTTTSTSTADNETCAGTNLLVGLQKTKPDVLASIQKKAAGLPYGEGLLWRIETKGVAPSFVYGTMHLSDPRLLTLPPKVKTAFESSSVLALEIKEVVDPEAVKEKMQGMVKYTTFTDGSTISDYLTEEQEKATKATFSKRSSIPWFLAKRLRPWAVIGAIASPACEAARKAAGKPFLDQSLAQQADKAGKELVSLETIESQIKAMASMPEKEMARALYETALLDDKLDDVFETMISLYTEEKIGVIWSMMKHVGSDGMQMQDADPAYAEFQRVIVDKRNFSMADSAESLIKKGGAFIAVGALHLPGENGILNILAQRGYLVNKE